MTARESAACNPVANPPRSNRGASRRIAAILRLACRVLIKGRRSRIGALGRGAAVAALLAVALGAASSIPANGQVYPTSSPSGSTATSTNVFSWIAINPSGNNIATTSTGVNFVNGDIAIGGGAVAIGKTTIVIQYSPLTLGYDATAVGALANAQGASATSFGLLATSTGDDTTAIGGIAKATSKGATALGRLATASGTFSTAIGPDSVASAAGATALGADTTVGAVANATDSIAIGGGTVAAAATSGIAIGNNAAASGGADTIALGDTAIASSTGQRR